MIDIQDILCILEVAKEKSITKAASNLFLTQSAVSQKISRTEKELGMSLFERTNRRVELTQDGIAFVNQGARLVADWEQFLSDMKKRTLKKEHYLTIGMHALSVFSDLPELIADFTSAYPNYKVNLTTHMDSLKDVHSGNADFFLINANMKPPVEEYRLSQIPLEEECLYILLHETDSLAGKEIIGINDLTGYHLISWNSELLKAFPKELDLTLTICEDSYLPSLISKPGYFTLTPKNRCKKILQQNPKLRAVPFYDAENKPIFTTLYLIYNSNRIDSESHPFIQFATGYYANEENV